MQNIKLIYDHLRTSYSNRVQETS